MFSARQVLTFQRNLLCPSSEYTLLRLVLSYLKLFLLCFFQYYCFCHLGSRFFSELSSWLFRNVGTYRPDSKPHSGRQCKVASQHLQCFISRCLCQSLYRMWASAFCSCSVQIWKTLLYTPRF